MKDTPMSIWNVYISLTIFSHSVKTSAVKVIAIMLTKLLSGNMYSVSRIIVQPWYMDFQTQIRNIVTLSNRPFCRVL